MASITRSLSARNTNNGLSEILLRVSLTMNVKHRIKSGIFVDAARFKDGQFIVPRANQLLKEQLRAIEKKLLEVEESIIDYCTTHDVKQIAKYELQSVVNSLVYSMPPEADAVTEFFPAFSQFLKDRELSKNRRDIYKSLVRVLHRFEMHKRLTADRNFKLTLHGLTAADLMAFADFYRNEWRLYDEYPSLYTEYPIELRSDRKRRRPQKRGENITMLHLRKLRAFFNWCNRQELTDNKPFDRFEGLHAEQYGKPIYLTIEERDQLYDCDFSSRPGLAVQRDIFVFQCLIGCRVSDLSRLTRDNLMGGFIEYVPIKTIKENAQRVRVPINNKAKEILDKYSNLDGKRLLPFISDQRYNDAIKEMLRIAGVNRIVTVINPTTGYEEQKPIWQVASSHMARRTFIGNLYKKVKDQNLIGSMTGHVEGSRAFARYRDIDDEVKRDIIDLLN